MYASSRPHDSPDIGTHGSHYAGRDHAASDR